MKNKISKKEIRGKISDSVSQAISQLEVKSPSKKVKRIIKRASKRIANKVVRDMKHSDAKGKNAKVTKSTKVIVKKEKPLVEVVA